MLRSVDVARASISLTTRSGEAGRPRCFPRVQPPYPRAHPPVRPVRTRHGRSAKPAQSAAASVRDGLVTTFYTYLQLTPAAMKRLGATLRTCSELNRSFWYCKAKGGNLWTCREFDTKKFRARKAERSCGEAMAMA